MPEIWQINGMFSIFGKMRPAFGCIVSDFCKYLGQRSKCHFAREPPRTLEGNASPTTRKNASPLWIATQGEKATAKKTAIARGRRRGEGGRGAGKVRSSIREMSKGAPKTKIKKHKSKT